MMVISITKGDLTFKKTFGNEFFKNKDIDIRADVIQY